MVRPVDARSVTTEDLITRYQRGQAAAFSALFDRYKDYVYRLGLMLLRNSGDVEEIVQETFMDLLRALPRYDVEGPARFETWLHRVSVNRCRVRLRRTHPPSADWDEMVERLASPNPHQNPQTTALQGEMHRALWQAVDGLADHHRLVILLRYLYDLPYQEIADVLEISWERSNPGCTRRTGSCGSDWQPTRQWWRRQAPGYRLGFGCFAARGLWIA
jgi:RNA polymerase sigma-70 factor (ECF subfamily)